MRWYGRRKELKMLKSVYLHIPLDVLVFQCSNDVCKKQFALIAVVEVKAKRNRRIVHGNLQYAETDCAYCPYCGNTQYAQKHCLPTAFGTVELPKGLGNVNP